MIWILCSDQFLTKIIQTGAKMISTNLSTNRQNYKKLNQNHPIACITQTIAKINSRNYPQYSNTTQKL
jgi:biotin synthase-like enzyme